MDTRYIVDASVWLAYLNEKDCHHDRCKKFFGYVHNENKSGRSTSIIIPAHTAIEININTNKKKGTKNWQSIPEFEAEGLKMYNIDLDLVNKIEGKKLWDKFCCLKAADAIYAIIAYLENIPLVTVDSDFDKVQNLIRIKHP